MGSVVAKCSAWLYFWYTKVLPFWPDFGTKSCHFFAFNLGSKFTHKGSNFEKTTKNTQILVQINAKVCISSKNRCAKRIIFVQRISLHLFVTSFIHDFRAHFMCNWAQCWHTLIRPTCHVCVHFELASEMHHVIFGHLRQK